MFLTFLVNLPSHSLQFHAHDMVPSYSALRFNSSENRTNSLAFAKQDCHTCAARREGCDRRRPRCGTCMSNKRICGGFAMDLVWKDLAVVNHGTLSRRGRESGCRSEKGPQQHTFKFTQGRPKRRRKPRDTNTVYQSILDLDLDDTPRHDATHSPNTTGTDDLLPASTSAISSSDEVGVNREWGSQSDGSMIYQLQYATHLSPGWQLLSGIIDSVDGNSIRASWPDTAEPVELPTQLILDPNIGSSSDIDNPDHANADLADELFPVADFEACLSNWPEERNTNHHMLEEDMQLIFPIKYRDLAHKYEPILAMCTETYFIADFHCKPPSD